MAIFVDFPAVSMLASYVERDNYLGFGFFAQCDTKGLPGDSTLSQRLITEASFFLFRSPAGVCGGPCASDAATTAEILIAIFAITRKQPEDGTLC